MEIEFLPIIDDNIYKRIKSFSNYSFYHSYEWHRFINETFKWNITGVVGKIDNEISFFLPLVTKRRLGLKKHAIALPFSHRIGILFIDSAKESLIDFEHELTLQLPNIEIHDALAGTVFKKKCLNFQTLLQLSNYNSIDELFKSFDYKSIRYEINKALKSGIRIDNSINTKTIHDFYLLELNTRHRQGAPVYPSDFFLKLFKNISKNDISMYIAYVEETPIAGSIFFHNLQSTIYAYSASKLDYKKYSATDLLVWYGIKNAFERGHQIFDFGTTPIHLEGLKKYKEKWGATSIELNYSYFPKVASIKRKRKMMTLITFILKKMPASIFRRVSPYLIKMAI